MRNIHSITKIKLFFIFCCLITGLQQLTAQELRVLQFNIWQEGTVIKNGFEAITDEIIRTKADLVAFSEVRNYQNSDFSKRIITALKKRGVTFYGQKSQDTGLISRFPLISQTAPYPVKNDHGSITKAVVDMNGTEIAFYSAHLDYKNCSYYMVRGYCGSTWKELPAPVTDNKTLIDDSRLSKRDDAIKAFIADAAKEKEKGRLIFIGGDFNEPSHLDWTKEMKNLYDHNGVVIDWECTKMLEKAGYIDSYRKIYPDPMKNPGFTYPSFNPDIPIRRLTWAPKSDERERIDFIFYMANNRLKLKSSVIVGPKKNIKKSKTVTENLADKFSEPAGVWPSDHKGLLSIFRVQPKTKK